MKTWNKLNEIVNAINLFVISRWKPTEGDTSFIEEKQILYKIYSNVHYYWLNCDQ